MIIYVYRTLLFPLVVDTQVYTHPNNAGYYEARESGENDN